VILNNGVFAKGFRPEEVRFAKDTTEEAACKTEEDEDEIVD
jgi:hypothetical protein